eukprot:gene16025-19007_t
MQSWFGGGAQPVANSSGQLVPTTDTGLDMLPAHEILRKLELERKEAARAREELFQKDEELREREALMSKRVADLESQLEQQRLSFQNQLALPQDAQVKAEEIHMQNARRVEMAERAMADAMEKEAKMKCVTLSRLNDREASAVDARVQTSTKQQLDDKTHQLEAANMRTTALLSQQNQLQSSFKTFQYQTDQDTMTTIRANDVANGVAIPRPLQETEVNNAKVEASNARRELQKFQREAADAHHRLEPLTKQLDEARLEIETKTSALWAAEHALEVSAAEKLKLREENDQMKIETTRALAQSQGLKNSLLEELSANSHSKVSGAWKTGVKGCTSGKGEIKGAVGPRTQRVLCDILKETMLRHEEEKDLLKADVRKAYEQVEDQILEANKARNAALHAQELMEKKQIHGRVVFLQTGAQVRNLQAAFNQIKASIKVMDVRFDDLNEEFRRSPEESGHITALFVKPDALPPVPTE